MTAAAARLSWTALPPHVQAGIERILGARVVSDQGKTGGFSPGLASRLDLGDGRSVFAKAINTDRNPDAPDLFRRESAVMAMLPTATPAPRLIATYDDGDWVVLVLEHIDGHPPHEPWQPRTLRQVITALAQLAHQLTPSPISTIPPVAADLAAHFQSWSQIAGAPPLRARLDQWTQHHLDLLTGLETGWAEAADGTTLLHTDIRADNILLTDNRVVFIDWPYAATGAAWMDLLLLMPSVAATSNVDPDEIWRSYPPARQATPDQVNAVLAALAGDFVFQSLQLAPKNIPTLRAHQAAKGQAALRWPRRRLNQPEQ